MKRISPEEARELMEKEGYVYVDVRSVPEFQAGHPSGAYNLPLMHLGPMGMSPNTDFMAVMEKSFPKEARLVVGCKSGGRSMRAVSLLEAAGYTSVVDQRCGFDGAVDPMGRLAEPGWGPKGLPASADAPADHTWEGLAAKGR